MPIEFKDVASLLSCRKFAEVEMVTGRNGRARCPFHGGEHYNLQFFKDGRCYCHVCHKAGDVVTLASAVWHVSQREAAEMLNEQFILGLDHQAPTPEDRERWQRRLDQRDAQRQAAEDAVAGGGGGGGGGRGRVGGSEISSGDRRAGSGSR